jgi:hypothetical protein
MYSTYLYGGYAIGERERERPTASTYPEALCTTTSYRLQSPSQAQRLPSGSDMGTVYGTKYDRLPKKEHKTPFSRISILFSIRSNSS